MVSRRNETPVNRTMIKPVIVAPRGMDGTELTPREEGVEEEEEAEMGGNSHRRRWKEA